MRGCSGLTTFPVLDSSSVTNFSRLEWLFRTYYIQYWIHQVELPFLLLGLFWTYFIPYFKFLSTEVDQHGMDISSCRVPSVDFSSITDSFRRTWYFNTSLTTYPANQFDNISSTPSNGFEDAWRSVH